MNCASLAPRHNRPSKDFGRRDPWVAVTSRFDEIVGRGVAVHTIAHGEDVAALHLT